jgi:ATP-dependent Clp protease ATP-binding subunit ClpC
MAEFFAAGPGSSPFDQFLAQFFGSGFPGRRPYSVDITRLMSDQARELVAESANKAAEWGRPAVGTEQLLWAATQIPSVQQILGRAGVDSAELAKDIEQLYTTGQTGRNEPGAETPNTLTPAAKRALLDAHGLARRLGSTYLGPEHLLLALAVNPESGATELLSKAGASPESLRRATTEGATAGPAGSSGQQQRQTGTPTLDQYGRDLTEQARSGNIDPVVGRDDEIEQTMEVLSRRTKNNPVLIGEAGVGKTAIVEGLAQRVAEGEAPDLLNNRRVVQLDLTAMVAGTRYRGDFEERMTNLLAEIREHRDELIVFIDELHTVVGAGSSEGSMGAGNMLKPALAKGELHIVGATTLGEYRADIEHDPALERRFAPILVPEPTVDDAVEILRGLRDRYEAHHQVRITDEALVAAADLADRYITDRYLPDKAIDLVDQAGARLRMRSGRRTGDVRDLERELDQLVRNKDQAVSEEDFERASNLRDQITELKQRLEEARSDHGPAGSPEVDATQIAETVSRITGVPVSQLTEEERDRLLRLESHLHSRVVGQDEAVTAVAEAVRRSRSGFAEPGKPFGSFLFLGPTGVGKTELARALAEALFGDEDRMVRIDMTEYGERHTVSRLIGAPPGYVGHDEPGQLTEAVRRRPYSVVLLDEVEKAHPDIFHVLMQVLDDGRLTDAQGRTVNFANTVLIMTSNLGSELIASSNQGAIGFAPRDGEDSEQPLRERLMRKLRESFRPEFLNRIDEMIVFRRLESEQLDQITELLLESTKRRAHAQDLTLEFTPDAVSRLSEAGYQPEFGARPLRRTIQRQVDNPLSTMALRGELPAGSTIRVEPGDDGLSFKVLEPSGTST